MKSPEEIADEIVETANDATRIVDGAHSCPAGHDDEDVDYFCCGCLRSMIAAAIREAEVRGATWGLDAARAAHNAAKGACESRDCCEGITTIALRSLDPAAISAERSAGTSPNDRLVTPKLAVAARDAGTVPPAPACDRCGGSGWDHALRYDGGGMKDEEFTPCHFCGGAKVLPCPYLREECLRRKHDAKHTPCPACGGKP